MIYEMPPNVAFGAGALCMLTCVLIVLVSVMFVAVHWLWSHVSNHNSLGIKRERGSFKLEADLQEKKPVQANAPRLLAEKRNGSEKIESGPPGVG